MNSTLDNKAVLVSAFKYCFDVLRDNEHLTGDKALRTLTYLLDLKLLEPQFGQTIDIDVHAYDFSGYGEPAGAELKTELLHIVRFGNLPAVQEDNLPELMRLLWDEILAVHPATRNVFLQGRGFNIRWPATYKKIIDRLAVIDFTAMEEDVLGDAYENVVKDVMVGKNLGQYFTPPNVKQMMVDLISPQLKDNGRTETLFDPAMGTGGFLITCLRNIIKQSRQRNIPLDWDFISSHIGGREAEIDTYQLAVSNMMITTGMMFRCLERGDSIRDPITGKYDIVLANPPFGIKGLHYDDIHSEWRNEYMPLASNSAVPLFLQAIISMLNIGGRCAVVLPAGQDISSDNPASVNIRKYLMKTCELHEIIYLPAGAFTNTSIKTCVLYFHKRSNGPDVLSVATIIRPNKSPVRKYTFADGHRTTSVGFYNFEPTTGVKTCIMSVPIEQFVEHAYKWTHTTYEVSIAEVYAANVIVRPLGEICVFLPKSKRKAGDGEPAGRAYMFYSSSQTCSKSLDTFDYEDECLIIGTGGSANIKMDRKFSCSADNLIIRLNPDVYTKYVYYYLLHNIHLLQKGFMGVGLQHVSKKYVETISIPLPPIEVQHAYVASVDQIHERIAEIHKETRTLYEKAGDLMQMATRCISGTGGYSKQAAE